MVVHTSVVVMWTSVLVVAAVLATVVADENSDSGPYISKPQTPRQQCSGYCKASTKFGLRKGHTYVYKYEGVVSTGVEGTASDTSDIHVLAEVHLRVEETPCDLTLLVRNAQLFDSGTSGLERSPRQAEWAAGLEQWPLRFSYIDGRVEQLCPAAEEASWTLDFKRALLSALQNSMPDLTHDTHLHERDITGTCETMYIVSSNNFDGNIEVVRHKNLHSCSGRGSHPLGLSGALPSSTPVVRSEQSCKQIISDNDGRHIASVECYETHAFTPFSNDQATAGLRTQANLTLALVNIIQNEGSPYTDLFVNQRTSLKGEFISALPEDLISKESVELTLKQLNLETQQGVSENVPQLFNRLVREMSALDDQQLVQIFDEIEEKRSRRYFLDALPLVGTSGSVKVMYLIYKVAEVSRDELESWLTALAFHKEPTLEMLDTLNLIIQEGGFHPKTWLAVGAVVHSYCQLDPACQDTSEVKSILEYLASYLGNSCSTKDKNEKQAVVAVLKAIGNAGVIPSLDVLQNCFMNEDNALEVRLSAITATRRLPCRVQNKLPILDVFLEKLRNSELRIAAYLAVMQCPTTVSLDYIRNSLNTDDVNQVLSFVWTHLSNHNLEGSLRSWQKEIHEMLQDKFLANKFKTDMRKFSRNYATSLHSDILNMGAAVDSNVVFSTNSYLPRSAYLNLTVDLFGEAVNLFEMGTRLEGFESMVEDLFSPAGYFPDESLQTMLRNMRTQEIEKTDVIQSMSDQFTKGVEDEPEGSFFARLFGNELYLTQFSSLNKLLDVKKPKKYNGQYLIDSLKSLFDHKQIDYSKTYKIINSQYVIPTVLGFPLRVEVNGTAAVSFEMKTEFDVFKIMKTKSGDLGFLFSPSAVLQIDGKMMVDAVFAQSSVETKASLNTNTHLDLKMSLHEMKIVDVVVNVPRDKVEVIDVKSAVYIRQREQLLELEGVGELTQWDTCSGKRVPTISGMSACSQLVMRNASDVEAAPFFPLSGRFHYALLLQKTDSFNAYKFHLEQQYESSNQDSAGKFIVSLDTPGSIKNRKLSAELAFSSNISSTDATLALSSPWNSMVLKGLFNQTESGWFLGLSTGVGDKQVGNAHVRMDRESSNRIIRFMPSLTVQSEPLGIDFTMSTHLFIVPGTLYSAGLTVSNPTEVLSISGEVSKDKGRYTSTAFLKTTGVNMMVNGRVVTTPSVISCKTQVDYRVGNRSPQSVEFSTKLQSNFKNSLTKRHLTLNLKMSQWEQYNTKASWVFHQGDKHCDSKTELTVGRTQWIQQFTYHNSLQQKEKHLKFTLSLESPTKNLDYRTELIYKIGDELAHAHILAQLNKEKRFISLFDYKKDSPIHLLEIELASPWQRAVLEAKVEAPAAYSGQKEINGTIILKWGDIGEPQWVSAGGKYLVEETSLSAHHLMEGWVEGREWNQPLRLKGEWSAKSEQGLILSNCYLNVNYGTDSYKTSAYYTKNPSFGKHDLKVDLVLPDNSYSSSFVFINNLELKNITVRLDLEKTLYFTSQLQEQQFETQLFWNFLEDRSQNVWVQYRGSGTTELAIISMPGHYASLTVDKLGQGLSSMNITAVWGESEGSANNAILLSTYWLLDPNPYLRTSLPTVYTNVHLITPFVGFERQSFEFHMNGSSYYYGYPLTKDVHVSTKWQDQFVILNFNQISRMIEMNDRPVAHATFTGEIKSSLEVVEAAGVKIDVLTGKTPFNSIVVDAAYNNWAVFAFNSTYAPSSLDVSANLTDIIENTIILSGDLSIARSSIVLKATLPKSRHVLFESEYSNWPNEFQANLLVPIEGYEVLALQYHTESSSNRVKTEMFGKAGKQFATFSTVLGRSESGLNMKMNMTSSSSVPDVTLMLEHEFYFTRNNMSLKESAYIDFVKNGKTVQSGQIFVAYTDEKPTSSFTSKSLQTILQFPGHYSSSNYSYKTQVKLAGTEVLHSLVHFWNSEKIEVSLEYEGLSAISGFVKKNGKRKADLNFQNIGDQIYRTGMTLPGGYSLKHHLFVTSWTNWDNSVTITTPTQKMTIKNVQTCDAENTAHIHKTTFFINKELSSVDLVINLDAITGTVNNVLFETTTPWSYPVRAKYDLIVNTGPTTKHAVEFTLKKDLAIKVEFDLTVIESSLTASFNLFSPFCKQLKGSFTMDYKEFYSKGAQKLYSNGLLLMDNNQVSFDVELVKNLANPKFKFSFNDTNENILHLSCSYDLTKSKKEASLKTSYFEQEVYLNGHYFIDVDQIEVGLIVNTPFDSWKELLFDFDSVLSEKYSMFVVDMKKEDKYILLSGTGTILKDLTKLSASLDYLVNNVAQKHSAVFELSRGQESGFVAFQLKNNETSTVDLSLKGYIESDQISSLKSYKLDFKSVLPIEGFSNTTLDVQYVCNKIKCELTGSTSHNNWHSLVKGENTFDSNGVGHLDFKVSTIEKKIELYVKHKLDEEMDSYYCHISKDDQFIDGTVSIAEITNGFKVTSNIESSVYDIRKISGSISFETSAKLLAIISSLSVNEEVDFKLKYIVHLNKSIGIDTAEHKLWISIPYEGFRNISGDLLLRKHFDYILTIQGNITLDTTTNTISFTRLQNPSFVWNCSIDLPAILRFSVQSNKSGLEVTGNVVPGDDISKLSLNLIINTTSLTINAVKDLNELFITAKRDENTLTVSGAYNKNTINTVMGLSFEDRIASLNFTSNIPNWRALSIALDNSNEKTIIGFVTKEYQHIMYFSAEFSTGSLFWPEKGVVSLALPTFFIDMNVKYDLKSDLLVELNYNFNGNKQNAKGKVTFLPYSTKIELETPIQGFEDLTLIGNLNKNDREGGFIFQNKEKQYGIELSVSLQSKIVELKGTVLNGQNEFTLSARAQNGTNEEPKSNSIYISAFKNKKSVFWLSLDGLYDLSKKSGIKISFSSYYHNQINFEILSFKREISHTLFLNYLSGNDYVFIVNATLVKEFSKPQLLIESQFGIHKNYMEMSYNNIEKRKKIVLNFKGSDEKVLNIQVEISIDLLASDLQFVLENNGVFPIVNNMNIVCNYNFINESSINISFIVNDDRYFELFMKSHSLDSVDFRSSLKSSDYIKYSYDISLVYQLNLPVAAISTNLNINRDFYRCTANLTWDHNLAATFFELTTNAGYGFKNAILSTHYKVSDVYSHMIDFTVDQSKLFHSAFDVLYPSKLSVRLVLPDTLFLPYVKGISGEYMFSNEEKKIKAHYKSDSDDKRLLDFLMLFKNQHHSVDFVFTRSNSTQNYNFGWLLGSEQEKVDLRTILVWENKTLFSADFHKRAPNNVPEDTNDVHKNFTSVLYKQSEIDCSWNVNATELVRFQFVGIFNSTDTLLYFTHPSTIYHQQFQIKNLEVTKSIGSETYFQTYYKSAQMTEVSFHYTDKLMKRIAHVNNNEDIVCSYNYTVTLTDRPLSLSGDITLKKLFPYDTVLLAKVTGAPERPLSMYFEIDLLAQTFIWDVSTPTQNITFGGTVNIHPQQLFCTNISLFLNSSSMPAQPFSVKYESDCKSNLHGSINFFEKDARKINLSSDKVNTTTRFNAQGQNILYFKTLSVTCEFSKSFVSVNGTFGEDKLHIQLENSKYIHSLELQSSWEALKILKISHVMDSSEGDHLGFFIVKTSIISLDWDYFITQSSDGLVNLKINSGKKMLMKISLDLGRKKEILIHVVKDGVMHVGKGTINFSNSEEKLLGEISVVLNEKEYKLSLERVITLLELKAKLELTTPTDDYFIEVQMNKQADQYSPFASLKYKTPIYPFEFADINIWYSKVPINNMEYFSMEEKLKSYSIKFIQTTIGLSLRTNTFVMNDIMLRIAHGDKCEVCLYYSLKKIQMILFHIEDGPIYAMKSSIDFQGFTSNDFFRGKTSLITYLDTSNNECFVSVETPACGRILFSSELIKNTQIKNVGKEIIHLEEFNRTSKLIVGKETYVTIFSQTNNEGKYMGNIFAKLMVERTFNFNYSIHEERVEACMELNSSIGKLMDTQFLYSSNTSDETWSKTAELLVNKFMSVPEHLLFKPKLIISQENNDKSIVKYQLNFTNGFKNELSFNGNCSVILPSRNSFSLDPKPSIIAHMNFDIYSSEYTIAANVSLQRKRIETAIKLIGIDKSANHNEDSNFTSLEFGGLLKDDYVALYFNNNTLSVSLRNEEAETSISAHLVLEKLGKNISFDGTVTYSPIFLLTITHTIFPTPCTVDIKVDLREQSLDSALKIQYNGLEQQAYVNVYLDNNPKYAELVYIDIWNQTHFASVYVDESNDEVTLRGNINSPALDEQFLVVTLGKFNDKIDLNMNDDCIFKAFKDDSRVLLDLYFGDGYKMHFKSEKEIEILITSPLTTGEMSFKLSPIDSASYFKFVVVSEVYQLHLYVNTDKLLDIDIKMKEDNILNSSITIDNNYGVFDLQVHCDVLKHRNRLNIKHIHDPIFLTVLWNSSYFHYSDLQIILGLRNEDVVSGIFELKRNETLFSSYLWFNKISRNVNMSFEAPLFSKMDKAELSGVLNFGKHNCEVNLTASLVSADTLLSQGTVYLVMNDDVFTSGFVINSKLKNYENVIVSLTIPSRLLFEGKVGMFLKIGQQSYDIGITVCVSHKTMMVSAAAQWQDFIISLEVINEETPFYADIFELNLQFMERKLKIGAWTTPNYPITDYIYFLEIDEKRFVEISHSLIIKEAHYKSKLIVHTIYKGHEKYGIDCEFKTAKNSKIGKIVKILASLPQFGNDLGIDFGFSYDNLLNYTMLAQFRIPYNNEVKTVRLFSLHAIQLNQSFSRINHSIECSGMGSLGLELEVYGLNPFVGQTDMASIETKFYVNNMTYYLKTKSNTEANMIDLIILLETPFDQLRQGMLQLHGVNGVVGSVLILSYNSDTIIGVNITEDHMKTKGVDIFTKWRSVAVKYLYEKDKQIGVHGYVCWDIDNKNTSQIGVSLIADENDGKYYSEMELILPSSLFPRLAVKGSFETAENYISSLLELEFPGLNLEGSFYKECAKSNRKSELEFTWIVEGSTPRHIGFLSASEVGFEETKHYFILQHFALLNDIVLTVYSKETLCGINVKYSPLKEDEITLEISYWMGLKMSGIKLVAHHLSTNTLLYGVANVSSTNDHTQIGLSISYISDQEPSKIKYVEIYGKKNKKSPQLFIGVASNGNNMAVGGSLWKKENSQEGMTLEGRVNQKDPLKLEMVMNRIDPEIKMELSYGLSRSYQMSVGVPSSNEVTAKLSHIVYGRPNLDLLATLRLNTSKILWGRVELPLLNHMSQEFYSSILAEYSDVSMVSGAIVSGFSYFAQEDFSKKALLLVNGVSSTSEVLVSQTYQELGVIKNGVKAVGDIVITAYMEDHLYMKTFTLLLKKVSHTVYDRLSCVAQVLASLVDSLLRPAFSLCLQVWQVVESVVSQWKMFASEIGLGGVTPLRDVRQMISQYQAFRTSVLQHAKLAVNNTLMQLDVWVWQCAQWTAEAEVKANQLTRRVLDMVEQQVRRLINYKDTVLAGFRVLGDTMAEMLEIVFIGVYDIKEVRYTLETVFEVAATFYSRFSQFHLSVYLPQFSGFCDRVLQMVIEDFNRNFGEYDEYLVKANLFLQGCNENLFELPGVKYIQTTVNIIYQKAKWFWNYANFHEKLKREIIKYIGNVEASLNDWEKLVDKDEGTLWSEYKYDEDTNSFTFTQELPFQWRAFNELPYNFLHDNEGPIKVGSQEFSGNIQKAVESLWKETKLLPSIIPPFSATALFSPRNIITFDNSFYHFSKNCGSHLLAGDLHHHSFLLVADYHNQNERDVILIVKDISITVKENLEVYINGKLEELPSKISSSYLLRIERKANSISIGSQRGFSLECNNFLNMCKFQLSGWYLGKTGGLLGTYNNEYLDDYLTPDHKQLMYNVKAFTDSWALKPRSCEENDELTAYDIILPNESKCEVMFSSEFSPLSPCFTEENPQAFRELCATQSSEDNTCASVFAYITKCAAIGVQLPMPDFCSDNSWTDSPLINGYSGIVEIESKMSADVVFVVESAPCDSINLEMVKKLSDSLATELDSHGLSQNQFGIVSFGSLGVHIHTFNGQLWTQDESLLPATVANFDVMDFGEESQYLSALETAATMPFRPSASKVIVLLHCSQCPSSPNLTPPLVQSLLQNGAVVHILQQENLLNRQRKSVSKVIGFEVAGAYPRNRFNKQPPSRQLLEQITVPQDLCSPLALRTNGTVFSIDGVRRWKQWAERVVNGALPTTTTKLCENTVGNNNVPVWRCHDATSKILKDYDQSSVEDDSDYSGIEGFSDSEE